MLHYLLSLRQNPELALQFCRSKNILKTILYCSLCNEPFHEIHYKRNIDGVVFRCNSYNCLNYQKYFNIRKSSFLESLRIPIADCLLVLYYFYFKKTQKDLEIDFNIKNTTIKKIYNLLYERIDLFLINNPIQLGGNNIICQIDESMFHYKQKYHLGRLSQNNRWVFGIIEINTIPSKFFVISVSNRTQNTLYPIIRNVCRHGTIIWSDEWRAYRNVRSLFQHETVNHSLNFVNPITNVHIQTMNPYGAS